MNVSPKTYKRLFDAICKAIVKKIDPNSEMKFTQKDIGNATETIKGKIVNICSHYLHSPFKYFVDGKTHANKGNSFTMQDYRLVKAIEFVNEVPEEEKYIGENWGDEAGRQLKKFEEKFPMNELNLQINNS